MDPAKALTDKSFEERTRVVVASPFTSVALPGDPVPNDIFFHAHNSFQIVQSTTLHVRDVRHDKKVAQFTIRWKPQKEFEQVGYNICSATDSIVILRLNAMTKTKELYQSIIATNFKTEEICWRGNPCETFLFEGGTNLGLGSIDMPIKWQRLFHNARAKPTHSPAKEMLFSTVPQPGIDEGFELFMRGIQTGEIIARATFNKPLSPLYCDSTAKGDIALLTVFHRREGPKHLILLQRGNRFVAQEGSTILAFDSSRGLMLASTDNPEPGVYLYSPLTSINGPTLRALKLDVPKSKKYFGQIAQQALAIHSSDTHEITLFSLKDEPKSIATVRPHTILRDALISQVTLFDDYLCVRMEKSANEGCFLIYSAYSGQLVNILDHAGQVQFLGKSGKYLVLHQDAKRIVFKDIIRGGAQPSMKLKAEKVSYDSGVFSYIRASDKANSIYCITTRSPPTSKL